MNSPPTRLQFRLSRSAIRPDSVTQYYSGRNFQFSFSKEKIEKGEGKLKKYVDAYALWEPHPIQRTPLAKASLSFKNATTSLAVSRPSSIFDNLILDKTSLYANYLCLFFLVRRTGSWNWDNSRKCFGAVTGWKNTFNVSVLWEALIKNMLVVFLL